jgi:hypothetical protein
MGYNEDFKKIAENYPKCKNCEFYDRDNKNLILEDGYYGKIAICLAEGSGRYIVGHNTICCEFFKNIII